jgi:hypothetical protein
MVGGVMAHYALSPIVCSEWWARARQRTTPAPVTSAQDVDDELIAARDQRLGGILRAFGSRWRC